MCPFKLCHTLRQASLWAQVPLHSEVISHHRHSIMPASGSKVPIRTPTYIKAGYYFLTCREYRTKAGILYNYVLYNKGGQKLKLGHRGGKSLC